MADVTELRCWPSCVDGLDWSQDGIIALASDERVELLVGQHELYITRTNAKKFPNTVSFDRDQDAAQWEHIPLQVPFFSDEELPIKEPAPLPNYSIGEEISSSAPIAIAWSPPGLAKHRRCALAALTANLVLSIWSADGKPKEASDWARRLIVNNALTDYFMGNEKEEISQITSSFEETMRLKTRVRTFAWAPALPISVTAHTLGSRLSFGQHMMAVCNDNNQLVIAVVDSPTSTCGADRNWSAEVLTHVTLTPDSESIFSEPAYFEDMMKQQKHISHVSWSPWIIRGDWYHSIIVYATNDDVRARVITYTHDSVGLGEEVIYANIEMRFNGPMKWSPRIDNDVLTLALFTTRGLSYLTISTIDASIVEQTTHDLDGRWDPVTGAIFDLVRRCTPRLHFSSLLSTIHNPTAVLEAKSTQLEALENPYWCEQIQNSAAMFSAKNDLKGNTKMKVWGLASSPLGDFIATCHSVHPSDMIEYGSPNERRGTVAISALRRYRQIREGFPAHDVSAEGILFTLKKLVENALDDSDELPTFVDEMVGKLVQTYGASVKPSDQAETPSSVFISENLDVLIGDFKRTALFNSESLKDQYTVLVSLACDSKSTNMLERTLIAYRLATSLLKLPDTLCQTSFSAEVCAHQRQLALLIRTLLEPEDTDTEMVDDTTNLELNFASSAVDACDFCSAPIPFMDLTSASCTNGHQFPRCGLSFLAIQAPGITKYCGICSTPFLSEEFVVAQEVEEPPARLEAQIGVNGDNTSIETTETRSPMNNSRGEEKDEDRNVTMSGNGLEQEAEQPHGEKAVVHASVEGIGDVSAEERRELPTSLARVLFLACDVCIYCGGKFIG